MKRISLAIADTSFAFGMFILAGALVKMDPQFFCLATARRVHYGHFLCCRLWRKSVTKPLGTERAQRKHSSIFISQRIRRLALPRKWWNFIGSKVVQSEGLNSLHLQRN
ncbi:hypothetical protein TNIN_244771 [Trichonephila inaurata madagascariensis]|uniref:Uncharacterized protein n=1 Tax=Trichonephila inaurata madagascariensis TaxID=2747483 RepID=A0A8X6Y6B8_9ARAC|nr:hypothetical protein TNIN_244771 [Trichonephila inaurata madagascariensis]